VICHLFFVPGLTDALHDYDGVSASKKLVATEVLKPMKKVVN